MTTKKTKNKCAQCGKEFKYESERKRHEQSHFPQFQCKVCNKSFSFNSALRRHEKQHERAGRVKCRECSREFRDNVLLNRHTKYAHSGSYSCTKCNATFNSDQALQSHSKTHKAVSERRYHCSFEHCNKSFNFSHHLKHHELTHTKQKQYYCKVCGKGFIQSHNYKAHLKTHSDDPSLHCGHPGCNKKFATIQSKQRHQAMHLTCNSSSSDSTPLCKVATNSKDQDTVIAQVNVKPDDITSKIIENKGNNCKEVLGSCIMQDKNEKCVCTEISESNNEECEFEPIVNEIEPIKINKLNITKNACESCVCSGNCDIKSNNSEMEDFMAIIEYTAEGNVKLKDTFDIDFTLKPVNKENVMTDNFIPFSCKDVLGNCIVSGNGTIGEGCLCARMAIDDQVTSQEIDDITPHPNCEFSSCEV